ncbi:MAG: hypothetical protein JW795_05375 [Chitinivibrionales bacterium]|nr:hypothetical protein [Chitinivibrionales bacterium]
MITSTTDSSLSALSWVPKTDRRGSTKAIDAPCCPAETGPQQPSAGKNGRGRSQSAEEQQEQQQIAELRARDREVRAHEQAHIAAGGSYVRGGAQYSYQTGPDGKQYAIGGEVSIDTSEVPNNPQATIAKMQLVRKAALAPANPSGQDKAVAAQAAQIALANQKKQQSQSTESAGSAAASPKPSPTTTQYTARAEKTAQVQPQVDIIV